MKDKNPSNPGPSSPELNSKENDSSTGFTGKKVSRRDMLRLTGVGGLGLLLGGGGIGSIIAARSAAAPNRAVQASAALADSIPFFGEHQAGILTPAQNFLCFAAFDLTTTNLSDVKKLFQAWTTTAASLTSGQLIGNVNDNPNLPPTDTGEADGLSPSRCTLTFGVGPSFFDGRLGLGSQRPASFQDLPVFTGDNLEPQWCGGDLCVQACADDMQVAFHAIRNLARIARGTAVLRWTQEGFQRSSGADPKGATPRNLLGFKDGTGNPDVTDRKEMDTVVWNNSGDGPSWMNGGTYMAVRRVMLRIEVWDRSNLSDQEATFGRHRQTGAPIGAKDEFDDLDLKATDASGKLIIPENSHSALAHGDGTVKMLRRSYSYSSGMNLKTGQLDAGLLFISFQRDLVKQFVSIQQRLSKIDKLNEYMTHTGSAVFACFPGTRKGGYIGQSLLG
ncbi:iron uptake transporter deferrochelatase/peroxidase subunit [Paenibacillus wynnii]|uniref:iron uptake transporter deferrochelatase/peroxidase subunit n=1 Tax=Paenibacillus wynnii TaxID=268407 RepID=UPI00278CD8A0|nr:iron uptake transporter deferrochelatase/peroxidase subunit [Paenibacillus wynnii]MDQ0194567.1 deferrochelatase/peroxidase EfeB [Paenibacillus wynnii]